MVKSNKPRTASSKPEHVKAEQVKTEQTDVQQTDAQQTDAQKTKKVELTPEEKKKIYKESVIRTVIATVLGIICGVILYQVPIGLPWFVVFILMIVLTYYIQRRGLFPILKLDVSILDWKSWFGLEFLVIAYCLVTWTILLNVNIL
jgi:hypothetical protein